MRDSVERSCKALRRSLPRAAAFFVFWVILSGVDAAGLAVGACTAIAAALVSLQLLPPGQWTLHPLALAALVLRYPWQSLSAGIDVARRALHPRMPLQPGFVTFRPRWPSGPTRNAFCTMVALLPGTLPCGASETGSLAIHCLDVGQPVAEQLAEEEVLLGRVLGDTNSHE